MEVKLTIDTDDITKFNDLVESGEMQTAIGQIIPGSTITGHGLSKKAKQQLKNEAFEPLARYFAEQLPHLLQKDGLSRALLTMMEDGSFKSFVSDGCILNIPADEMVGVADSMQPTIEVHDASQFVGAYDGYDQVAPEFRFCRVNTGVTAWEGKVLNRVLRETFTPNDNHVVNISHGARAVGNCTFRGDEMKRELKKAGIIR